jgi:hypothetical protein
MLFATGAARNGMAQPANQSGAPFEGVWSAMYRARFDDVPP